MLPEELEELASEYVLGTLDAAEREEAKALLRSDRNFAVAVRRWERRLVPLAAEVKPVTPPEYMRRRILGAIGGGAEVIRLKRQVNVWRGLSLMTGALAAALTAFMIWNAKPSEQGRYVAVLQPDSQGPAFIATVDVASGAITVRRVLAEAQAGKSYELWAVGGGRAQPESLGLIDGDVKTQAMLSPDTVLAVSLEPAGGSPTGQPTGPVLYTGKLVATE